MTYSRLTKSQLLDKIEELESQTLSSTLNNVINELKLLAKDIQKAVAFTYNAGVECRAQLQSIRIFK